MGAPEMQDGNTGAEKAFKRLEKERGWPEKWHILFYHKPADASESEAKRGLIVELCLDELAVQASDVGYPFVLRTNSFAGTRIGTVAEPQLVHSGYH